MKYVYLLKYNNYCNRIMKRESSYTDYLGTSNANVVALIEDMLNWNPNDGVTTSIKTPTDTSFDTREPDYCICVDAYGNIDSRWFVIENIRARKGQYICKLKRDVFAEAWPDLLNATCNIDRAILSNDDPLIFNPEPINVNQILKNEIPIIDKTGIPWIVFYGASTPNGGNNVSLGTQYYDITTANKATWEAQHEFNYLANDVASIQAALAYMAPHELAGRLKLIPSGFQNLTYVSGTTSVALTQTPNIINPLLIDTSSALSAFKSQFTLKSAAEAEEVLGLNGKIIYDSGEGKYYTINATSTIDYTVNSISVDASATYVWAKNTLAAATDVTITPTPSQIVIAYQYRTTQISFTEISVPGAIDFHVPANSVKPYDAPYYMWCMPYGDIYMTVTDNGTTKSLYSDKKLNWNIANWFANMNSSDNTFDVQILPFCPLPDEFIDSDGEIVVNNDEITDHTTIVDHNTNDVLGYIFACPVCTFTKQIKWTNPTGYFISRSKKLTDTCQKFRLYSPNYASTFEFSGPRNEGIRGFNVRCTYMPIQPYMRVAPMWGGLYGEERFDKDPRGLICNGNFSVARLNDPWVQYQEQNKNFQAIFNREIEHMDTARKYERAGQIGSAVSGVITGTAAGIAAGTLAGGVGGAVVGGIIGGVGSAVTGAADVAHSEKLFQESKSYATDIHFLQLGNVQALPRSLAKTTAFHIDNRFFPILAIYEPTEKEIDIVDKFINNHSMNVNAIGKPIDYIYNRYSKGMISGTDRGFISGSIIKIDTPFDTHFIDELNIEFQKGVYTR